MYCDVSGIERVIKFFYNGAQDNGLYEAVKIWNRAIYSEYTGNLVWPWAYLFNVTVFTNINFHDRAGSFWVALKWHLLNSCSSHKQNPDLLFIVIQVKNYSITTTESALN